MKEIEKAFLVTIPPADLEKYPAKKLVDRYIPIDMEHPSFRIRQHGDLFILSKKTPTGKGIYREQNIVITPEEYTVFEKVPAKIVQKKRYLYGEDAQVDVFEGDLKGLIIAEFEFATEAEMNNFVAPKYCGKELTGIKELKGGSLCGKSYEQIKEIIDKL
jgi:adenylate cyclase